MKKILLLLTALVAVASASALNFTPDCTYQTNNLNGWHTAFNDFGDGQMCLYDSETIYLTAPAFQTWYNPGTGWEFIWTQTSIVDFYIDDINWSQDKNLKFQDGMTLRFDYHYPFLTIGETQVCPASGLIAKELILMQNDREEGFTTNAFHTTDMTLMNITCGSWHNGSFNIDAFGNDHGEQFGNSFSANSNSIGAIALEMGNVYIKNVRLCDYNGLCATVWNGTQQI